MFFKRVLKFLSSLSLAGLLYFVVFQQQGCSDVTFDSLEPLSCDEFPVESHCTRVRVEAPPDGDFEETPVAPPEEEGPRESVESVHHRVYYDKYNYFISLGRVTFLFVLDTSSSMAKEHRNLADQISPFLNDIRDLRYNIGVSTMDISESSDNLVKDAYYQDGKLIPIGGRDWLTNTQLGQYPDKRVINDFKRALEREETKKCDLREQPRETGNRYERYFLQRGLGEEVSCPSFDERGTYSMKKTVENPRYSEFFNKSHVLFIPVSDEGIRGGEDFYSQYGNEKYRLEDEDLPETLLSVLFKKFPRSRTFSFHPIIIAPRDHACLKSQNRDSGKGHGSGNGYYGYLYAKLTRPHKFNYENSNFLRGNTISICNRHYKSQLSQISIFVQEAKVPIPCHDPYSVYLRVNGRKVDADYRIEGRTLYIAPENRLSLSSEVEVEVYCEVSESDSDSDSDENALSV